MDDRSYDPNAYQSSEPPKKQKKNTGKRISVFLLVLIIAILLGSTVLGSFYTIGEQESAVVTTFGVPRL